MMTLDDPQAPRFIKATIEDWKDGRISKARLCEIFDISLIDFSCTGADHRHATVMIWEDIKKCEKIAIKHIRDNEQARQDERQKCIPSTDEILELINDKRLAYRPAEYLAETFHNWLEGRRL